ncbi:MAG: hypothetical protein ABI221_03735 [Candidatus Saccharimonadales bacterium]
MQIVGLTGAIGHGKSSLLKALQAIEPSSVAAESSELISHVANDWLATIKQPLDPTSVDSLNAGIQKLIAVLAADLGVDVQPDSLLIKQADIQTKSPNVAKLVEYWQLVQANPSHMALPIGLANKDLHRPILQWLGGFLVQRVGTGVWYDHLVGSARAAATKGAKLAIISGLRFTTDADVIKQTDGAVLQVLRPQLAEADLLDPTERDRAKIVADSLIVNDGSLLQLGNLARQLYSDLKSNRLESSYLASNY